MQASPSGHIGAAVSGSTLALSMLLSSFACHCCDLQVGWSKPVAVLHKDNMPAGKLHVAFLKP
jgi:hypothetical protein